MDKFVIYNKNTGKRYGMEYGSYKEWSTASSAKGALTRLKKKFLKAFEDDLAFTYKHIDKYATQESRDAHREEMKEYNSDWQIYEALCSSEVVTYDYFYEHEPLVMKTNKMSGKRFIERMNTPYFLSPSSDNYWSA